MGLLSGIGKFFEGVLSGKAISGMFGYTGMEGIQDARKEEELSKELKKEYEDEMRTVFKRANSRIRSLSHADIDSPAVRGLAGYTPNDVYGGQWTVFKVTHDWEYDKEEYGRALAFLQQPTSTVTGYRAYENAIIDALHMPPQMASKYSGSLVQLLMSYGNNRSNVFPYRDRAKQDHEEMVADVSTQIELDALTEADSIQAEFEAELDALLDEQGVNNDDLGGFGGFL